LDSSDEIEAVLYVSIRLLYLLYTDDNIIFWFCYWIILLTCYYIMLYWVHLAWAGFEHICFFLKYCSLVIKQQLLNQRMKLIINKFVYAFPISAYFYFTFFTLFLLSGWKQGRYEKQHVLIYNNFNRNRVIVFIIISKTFTLQQVGNMHD